MRCGGRDAGSTFSSRKPVRLLGGGSVWLDDAAHPAVRSRRRGGTQGSLPLRWRALASVASRRASGREAPVRREHLPRLLLIGIPGGLVAPACLAWVFSG